MKAAIIGLAGSELTDPELARLQATPPAGVILFARNIQGPIALARLIGDLREVLPAEAVVMVDQEGGRVARLAPPAWPAHPAAGTIGARYAEDPPRAQRLAWLTGALIGYDCAEAGFDVVCAPVLDLRTPYTTDAIGDRSYGTVPGAVATLGQAMADGLLSAGIQPVGKHAPGHGHARTDSHMELPFVPPGTDLSPEFSVFAACIGLPWMMTAHLVYQEIDPTRPGTLSPIVIQHVIREAIGFPGVLVSDDLAMGALSGTPADRAAQAIAAGCDLALHCSGKLAETAAVLDTVPNVTPETLTRMRHARNLADRSRLHLDRAALLADQAALLDAALAE